MNKADWNLFQYKLDFQINVTNFHGSDSEQLENATLNWIKTVKSSMDTVIPTSTHHFT